jgi:hypothetical protein
MHARGWQYSSLPHCPRSLGLTLSPSRCPIECRLTRGDDLEWSCRVFLRRVSVSNGQSKFGQSKEPFGDKIVDRDLLEGLVLRAQLAILNPSIPYERFLHEDLNLNAPSELSFSPNIVCLEITGPEYTDISFVDLPGAPPEPKLHHASFLMIPAGLIRNVGTSGNPENIKLIEDLATNYISRDNCIILMTITCESMSSCLTSV